MDLLVPGEMSGGSSESWCTLLGVVSPKALDQVAVPPKSQAQVAPLHGVQAEV